ncbi:MAG TPA: polysaccharide deacetylase family protein [Deltaproteobacteria bacterium]|nr:polysaccharide deacetylase family protein [Deltaproteobacteria bacterium]
MTNTASSRPRTSRTSFRLCLPLIPVLILFLAAPAPAYVTVLLYHRFDEDRYPTTTTSTSQFEKHLSYLKANGYAVMSMDDLAGYVQGGREVPEKAVVITIDDGFISEYERAVPLLRKYGYPFTIFVFTNGIGAKGYVSWEQLKVLEAWGGTVGCHTHTHPRLINLRVDQMEQETMGSRRILEKNLGHPVRYFAYPFGQYDERVRAAVKKAGFRLMLSSDPGSVGRGTEFDRIPRQAVVGAQMSLKDFAEKLRVPPLVVTDRLPSVGTLPSGTLKEISLTIRDPHLYDPSQINLFLSEKGRLDARFDRNTGVVSFTGPLHLTRKTNRIIISARRKSDGLFALDSYLIVLPGTWEGMKYTMR